jgi:excisionase family DNA binding protein
MTPHDCPSCSCDRVCVCCGGAIVVKRPAPLVCSNACYQKLYSALRRQVRRRAAQARATSSPGPTSEPSALEAMITQTEAITQMVPINRIATQLGVSAWTVRTWIRQGRIPSHKVGRRVLVKAADVQALLDAHYRQASRPSYST